MCTLVARLNNVGGPWAVITVERSKHVPGPRGVVIKGEGKPWQKLAIVFNESLDLAMGVASPQLATANYFDAGRFDALPTQTRNDAAVDRIGKVVRSNQGSGVF